LFEKGASTDNMPTTEVASGELSNGINIIDLLLKTKLIPSRVKAADLSNRAEFL